MILYKDKFTVRDFPEKDGRNTINYLLSANAITKVDSKRVTSCGDYSSTQEIGVYAWKRGVQENLQNYQRQRDELPCGHRVHIHNPDDSDNLGCKFCDAEYARETIENLL